jgi:hypothetical protein
MDSLTFKFGPHSGTTRTYTISNSALYKKALWFNLHLHIQNGFGIIK